MVSEDGALRRLLGHEARAVVNETRECHYYLGSSLDLFYQMKRQEDGVQPGRELSPEPTHAAPWPRMFSLLRYVPIACKPPGP